MALQTGDSDMAIRIGWLTGRTILWAVIIIVLAGLVLGGLFIVRDRSETAQREEAIKMAEQKLEEDADKGVAVSETPKQEETTNEQPTTNELPATGAQDVLPFIVAAGLAFSIASFIASRRQLRLAQASRF